MEIGLVFHIANSVVLELKLVAYWTRVIWFFHNWYVGMMYSIYSYLVFYITIWIEHVLYFLTKER